MPQANEVSGMYRRGFNDPIEGAKRYLELHVEIGEMEDHECPDPDCVNFQHCPTCEDISLRASEQREIVAQWSRKWAQGFLRDQPHNAEGEYDMLSTFIYERDMQ